MKLITNKPYDSLFAYFPGVEDPNGWTFLNPKVCLPVRIGSNEFASEFNLPASGFDEGEGSYVLFKVGNGIEYTMSSEASSVMNVFFYDYLEHNVSDVEAGINSLNDTSDDTHTVVGSSIGNGNVISFRFKYPAYILAKIVKTVWQSNVKVSIFPATLEFDYSPRTIRDWTHRIDGTGWNVAGKIPRYKSLFEINRRCLPSFNVLEALSHGVYGIAKECGEKLGGADELIGMFENCANYNEHSVLDNVSFSYDSNVSDSSAVHNPFQTESGKIAVRLETLLYSSSSKSCDFKFDGNGEFFVEINDFSSYCDFSELNGNPIVKNGVQINEGYNKITIYYNSDKNGTVPSFLIRTNDGNYWEQYAGISSNVLFLPNNFNLDEYIPFESIVNGARMVTMYKDSYITVSNDEKVTITTGDTPRGFTIGMSLRFQNVFTGLHGIFHGRGFRIYRIEPNVVRVESDGQNQSIDFTISYNTWHTLFVMTDGLIFSWYFDFNTNGIRNNVSQSNAFSTGLTCFGYDESFINSDETRDLLSYGSFDLKNVIISNRVLRQGEVNRICNNAVLPND